MRILSRSPAPPLRLDRLYENINLHGSSLSAHGVRLHPTRSRCIALFAWMVSLFSIATILCINLGGVSWPLANQENPISRLGNPGFELLQWFFDGPPPSTSIANFYHYRLTLNRLCAINPTRQRGYGLCYNAGPLGSFLFSQHSPDAYIAHERAYDAVVGRVDLFSPFLFYLIAGACAATSIVLLPVCIVTEGAGGAGKRNADFRSRAAAALFGLAVCLAVASGTLTYSILHLAKWMQYVPQVSHIWTGKAPLILTWVSTASSIVSALAMLDDAALARRALRDREAGKSLAIDKRGRSRGRTLTDDAIPGSWDAVPQSAVENGEVWGVKSPRKRLGHGATFSWGTVESPILPTLEVSDVSRKVG